MGLDMYMMARNRLPQHEIDKVKDIPDEQYPVPEELGYWRKHNALHGWMEQHWEASTYEDFKANSDMNLSETAWVDYKSSEQFNLVPFFMSQELLDELRTAVDNKDMEPTEGFFFGSTDYDVDEYKQVTLEIIDKADKALKEGKIVYYDSWW